MKKTFMMEDLDCAHCAAKMEAGIAAIEGVQSVTVNFLAQKMVIEAEEEKLDEIMKQAIKVVHKIDPECEILL